MKQAIDLTGRVFGRLKVLRRSGANQAGRALWLCLCECGKTHLAESSCLRSGATQSCGCIRRERAVGRNTSHGRRYSPEYASWCAMLRRCTNPTATDYSRYGGRGITVCERWLRFETFFADMGPRAAGRTLERIDNEKGYEPLNCRWATTTEQNRNKRTNVILEWQGRRLTLAEWAEHLGADRTTLEKRLQAGWSLERTLSQPVRRKRPKRQHEFGGTVPE